MTALGIVLVAVNMRLPITGLPPIMAEIQRASGLSTTAAGLLTSIPLLTFALVSSGFARASRRFGATPVMLVAFMVLTLGSLLRVTLTVPLLLLGTLLIGLGIDGGNVILPAIIKARMPQQPTLGVSLYTTSMVLMSSLATAIVGPLTKAVTLTGTLKIAVYLSLISILGCGLLLVGRRPAATTTPTEQPALHLSHNRLAWLLTAFFGLQALLYYSLVTWMPAIFQAVGYTADEAALLVTILQLACLACAVITPLFATSKRGKAAMLWTIALGFGPATLAAGFSQNHFGMAVVLALLMGIASGFSFNLAVIFFTQKTRNAAETMAVSGMAQTFGYLLAAGGPVVLGWLNNSTGSWTPSLLVCLGLAGLILVVGRLIERRTSLFEPSE
ncbi:MFS transporter [Lactiplantibacillus plajomi]|uniref:MFS transporter n=1 Tax=Lactiplantibacillus plajomi TaxID=1457217 RepID=A0ABV6K1S5_9LACO|nr:MFS transporter [Lactiplantibacillus plajomi]